MSDAGDEIQKTYINSTRAQRAYWTHLMLEEKKRTDKDLNLSEFLISQLPEVPEGWYKPKRSGS